MTPTQNLNSYQWNAPIIIPTRPPGIPIPQERTPLIRKANSFYTPTRPKGYDSIEGERKTKARTKPPHKIRPLEPIKKAQETLVTKVQRPLGRSTFGQTVSKTCPDDVLSALSQRLQIQAFQFDCCTPWYRDAGGTPRLFLRRMGLRYPVAHRLRRIDMLHVGISVVGMPLE